MPRDQHVFGAQISLLALAVLACRPAHAQVVHESGAWQSTLEAYVNVTGGDETYGHPMNAEGADDVRLDAAVRWLVRTHEPAGPNWGARLVVEQSPDTGLDLAEASLLFFGGRGRLEVGERQGLPDVLTGYAPNNFAFTSADFGPASGPSLDPGGSLPTSFIAPGLAADISALTALGASASLSDDRSAKVLYVSPKSRGFIAGLSYAPDADDARFGALGQAGLVREWYWSQHVLRAGGSFSHAQGEHGYASLDSLNAGVTVTLFDSLSIGAAATWNGDSGLPREAAHSSPASGFTASVNYNSGPWTFGGYLQQAKAEGDPQVAGRDAIGLYEIGGSWRYDTHWRVYGALYDWRFVDEGASHRNGRVLLIGLRATL